MKYSFSVKSDLNKTCCELNLSDNRILAVTHKLINYVRYTKEGNVLFIDAMNTFYIQLYGIGHNNNYGNVYTPLEKEIGCL